MFVKELIASHLNRLFILLNQNVTAKLEFSFAEGKVNLKIFHDFVVNKQTLPPEPPFKKAGHNKVLKKNLN